MLKRIFFTALLIFLSAQNIYASEKFEVAEKVEFDIKAGTNDYFLGDYAGSNKHKFFDPAAGLGIHYWFTNHFAGSLEYNFSRLYLEIPTSPVPIVANEDLNSISLMMKYRVFEKAKFNITFSGGAGYLWYDQTVVSTPDSVVQNSNNYDRKAMVMPLGVNFSYFIGEQVSIHVQAMSFTTFKDRIDGFTGDNKNFLDKYDTYLNILGGFSFFIDTNSDRDKDGINDSKDKCPTQAEDFDGFQDTDGCPDNDNDNDGIADIKDKCPLEAEDIDGFQDADGCPDPDNDADGILDINDKCPNEAEDTDGFKDKDGCPNLDDDNDGIPDTSDLCPNEAEDKDGFQDEDGCADNDNDKDGIADVYDKCPNAAENINGLKDNDGCPDVILKPDENIILYNILFDTNEATILPESYIQIDKFKEIFEDNPRALVQIEGHTDIVGTAAYNKTLSLKRSQAVRNYMIEKMNIKAERLRAVGFGSEKPIADNTTEEGRSKNRRIEFKILSNKVEIK